MATNRETKEALLYRVHLCEEEHLYEHMVEAMKKVEEHFAKCLSKWTLLFPFQVIKISADLNAGERNLLSRAYKGALSSVQSSLRALCELRRTNANITEKQLQVVAL